MATKKFQTLAIAKNGIQCYADKDMTLAEISEATLLIKSVDTIPDGLEWVGSLDAANPYTITKEGGEKSIYATMENPTAKEDQAPVTWGAQMARAGLNHSAFYDYFGGGYDATNKVFSVAANAAPQIRRLVTTLFDGFGSNLSTIALKASISAGDAPVMPKDGLFALPLTVTHLNDDETGRPFHWASEYLVPQEAVFLPVVTAGALTALTVISNGEAYPVGTNVELDIVIDGEGNGAEAVAIVDERGRVVGATITAPGTGYTQNTTTATVSRTVV